MSPFFIIGVEVAFAGFVDGPDQTATVDPRSPVDSWKVTNGATLNVLPGAATRFINAYDSTVNVDGATVTGSAQGIELIGSQGVISNSTISAGPNSVGIYIMRSKAGNTATATISGSNISAGRKGLDVSGGATVDISDSTIQSGYDGVSLVAGSTASLTRTSIETTQGGARGLYVVGGSTANVVDSFIKTNGAGAAGAYASGTDIEMIDTIVETSGEASEGLLSVNHGSINVTNASVSTSGFEASAVVAAGPAGASTINLSGGNYSTSGVGSKAIEVKNGSHISVGVDPRSGEGVLIHTTGDRARGIDANNGTVDVSNATIVTEGNRVDNGFGELDSAAGIVATNGGSAKVVDTNVKTTGYFADGIVAERKGSVIDMTGGNILTTGDESKGVTAYDGGVITITDVNIRTDGGFARGIVASSDSSIKLTGGSVITTGAVSHALNVANNANISAANTVVSATGAGASALFSSATNADTANSVTLEGSSLVAENGAAIRVENGILNVDAKNNTQIIGSSGTLLEVASDAKADLSADGGVALIGDIVNAEGGEANLALSGGSLLRGSMQNANLASVDASSHWQMTSSSDVYSLTNNGVVEFDSANPYKTLTVNSLSMDAGSFILNTKLNKGGADTETDKIVVTGDASGDGLIHVRNNGGTGAYTGTGATDGIQVVQIAGASDADFKLGSAAIVGIYDYQLKKADGQNWYLQTEGSDVVDPGNPGDDSGGGDGGDNGGSGNPGTGHVVDLVPGYNIALSAAQNHVLTTLDTFHERLGELRAEDLRDGYHAWMRGIGKTGSYSPKSITGYNGHGFDMTTGGVQIGADYSKSDVFVAGDKFTVGIFGEYANSSFDVRGRTADGSISSKGLGGYVTWQQKAPTDRKPGTGAYVDAVVKQDWLDFGVSAKSVSGFDLQNGYKGKATTASIETGYGFDLGNNVVLQPQAQLTWSKVKADSFTDSYGIAVHGQEAESLIGRVGVRLEKTFYFGDETTMDFAPAPARKAQKPVKSKKGKAVKLAPAVMPEAPKKKLVKSVTTFVDANVKREFKGKNGLVASETAIGNDMSGTRYDVGAGVVARVSENVSLFGRGAIEFGGSTNIAGKVSGGLKITW